MILMIDIFHWVLKQKFRVRTTNFFPKYENQLKLSKTKVLMISIKFDTVSKIH